MYKPPELIEENPFETPYNISQGAFPSSSIIPNMGNTMNGQPVINMNTEQYDKAVNAANESGLKPSNEYGESVLNFSGQLKQNSKKVSVAENVEGGSVVANEPENNPMIYLFIFIVVAALIFYSLKQ